MKFVLFTDDIRDLSIRDACRAAKKAGFDGLDLTLRPGGHVVPENAGPGLAEAHQVADEEGFAISMATTAITAADALYAEQVIDAVHFRIPAIKLGYWHYQPFGTAMKQFDEARRKLEGIIRLARRYHVRPCVHLHSGKLIANTPLIYQLLKDFSPDDVGAYVDTMHMTVEGGDAGWEMALDLVKPWVALVGVKNFLFHPTKRDEFGLPIYEPRITPLAEGMVRLPAFFKRLKEIGYDGIVSLHSEYRGDNSLRRMNTAQIIEQSAADLKFLKGILAKI